MHGQRDRVRAVAGVKLAQDVAHVGLYGARRDDQLVRDPLQVVAASDPSQDLQLARLQRTGLRLGHRVQVGVIQLVLRPIRRLEDGQMSARQHVGDGRVHGQKLAAVG